MIKLPPQDISDDCKAKLAGYQEEINGEPDYLAQVAKAKGIWPNRKQNQPFEEVKAKLAAMSAGGRRCHYCEDSMADEVEHFRPKNVYPDKTFVWENYLYSCGPCNGPKGDQFAIFEASTGNHVDLTPPPVRPGKTPAPRTSPPPGEALLINPREENPLDFIFLDLLNQSYAFEPWEDDPDNPAYQRAAYTIQVLRLNARDDLVKARELAYTNYKARLTEYVFKRDNGAPQDQLDTMIDQIKKEAHPSVWQEMKQERMRQQIPELNTLFTQAPEALTW